MDYKQLPEDMDAAMETKKWFAGLGLLFALVFSGSQGSAGSGLNFNDLVLNGRYIGADSALEWYTPSGGSPVKLDISASFIVQLDGKGNGVGTITDIIADANGAFPATLCVYATTGTYSLNTDGTGTATFNLTTTSPGCSDGQETYALTYLGNGSKYCGVVTGFTFPPGVDVSSIVGSFCAVKQ